MSIAIYPSDRGEAGVRKLAQQRADGTTKRRGVDPATCERHYTAAEVEFMSAMDAYKRSANRPFPTWSEALEVLISLGYRKVIE